jgi:alpha-beta hydrolase superfamily lysophospholipase
MAQPLCAPLAFSWARIQHCAAALTSALLLGCASASPPAVTRVVADTTAPAQRLSATATQFDLSSGDSLAARVWTTPEPRHIVLGVHGFNDYSKAFDPLAQHLSAELGATVYAYDQRGFGANPEPGVWSGVDTLLADLRSIAEQLRQRHPGLPLTVVGESMGGALVWVAAAESPGLVADQIVLKAPAVWGARSMPWYQRLSLQFMNRVAPDMTFTGRGVQSLGITPTDDVEVSRDFGRDPLFIKATRVSSLAGVTELMGRAQGLSLTPPQRSLVLYGLRDRIIPPSPVCDWLTHLNAVATPSGPLDFVVYPEGWHLLTRQLHTREVLQDMALWLDQGALPRRQSAQAAQLSVCRPHKTQVLNINGHALVVDVYGPTGVQTGAAILTHGFTRSRTTMAEHAQALAAQGVLTLTPDMPCTFDFHCNARAIAELVSTLRDTETFGSRAHRVMLVGFSAGGLSSLLAADTPGVVGLVALDPFDRVRPEEPESMGLLAAKGLQTPTLILRAPASSCNAQSVAAPWGSALPALWRDDVMPGASHCDFEAPTDWICRLACGAADVSRQLQVRQSLLEAAAKWLP